MPFDSSEYVDFGATGGRQLWRAPAPLAAAVWSYGARETKLPAPMLAVTLPQVILDIEGLRRRPLNWDGYGGVAPSEATIRAMKQLYWLLPQTTSMPVVQCAGDGEVSFAWRDNEAYLELGIDDDGTVSYFGRAADREPILGDLDGVPDSLPDCLRTFLDRYFDAGVRVRASVTKRAPISGRRN